MVGLRAGACDVTELCQLLSAWFVHCLRWDFRSQAASGFSLGQRRLPTRQIGSSWADGDGMTRYPPRPHASLDGRRSSILDPEVSAGGITFPCSFQGLAG